MTDIGVYTVPSLPEDLSWDLSSVNRAFATSATLDVSTFTPAQHYPNGYIPSGTVLGKVTATGLLGPYLDAATDGRQTAVGYLRASVQVLQPLTGQTKTKVGCAVLKALGVVSQAKLPFTSTNAPAGGYIDANGINDLAHIRHEA